MAGRSSTYGDATPQLHLRKYSPIRPSARSFAGVTGTELEMGWVSSWPVGCFMLGLSALTRGMSADLAHSKRVTCRTAR
jgi:hypothetical protein